MEALKIKGYAVEQYLGDRILGTALFYTLEEAQEYNEMCFLYSAIPTRIITVQAEE